MDTNSAEQCLKFQTWKTTKFEHMSSGGLQFSSDFTGGSQVTCQRQFIVSGLPIRMPVPLIQQDAVFFLAANKCNTHKMVLKLSSINSEVGFNKQTA